MDIFQDALPGEAADFQHRLALLRHDFGECFIEAAPDHQLQHFVPADLGDRFRPDDMTVAQDREGVRNLEDFVHPVRDVNDPNTLGLQAAYQYPQIFQLMGSQRCGRLIHRDHFGLAAGGFGDLNHLALGNGQPANGGPDIQGHTQAVHQILRIPAHLRGINPAGQALRLAPQKDIFRYRKVRGQMQLLIDNSDAQLHRFQRGVDLHGLPVQVDRSRIGPDCTRQNLHQCGLACAVLPHQRMHLAGTHGQGNIVENTDARVGFSDARHFQDGRLFG